MTLGGLVRNWWMMAVRGGLAVIFGLALLLDRHVTLSILVVLFAAYAILDGAWAIAAGVRASDRRLEGWPVALEGAVGVGLGVLALGWPFVSRELVYFIAGWGIVTGVLEMLAALSLPADGAAWLLVIGALTSLFLAVLVVLLPRAEGGVVALIGAYALVFGVLLSLAALGFRTAPSASRAVAGSRLAGQRRRS